MPTPNQLARIDKIYNDSRVHGGGNISYDQAYEMVMGAASGAAGAGAGAGPPDSSNLGGLNIGDSSVVQQQPDYSGYDNLVIGSPSPTSTIPGGGNTTSTIPYSGDGTGGSIGGGGSGVGSGGGSGSSTGTGTSGGSGYDYPYANGIGSGIGFGISGGAGGSTSNTGSLPGGGGMSQIPSNYVQLPGTSTYIPPALYNAAYGNQANSMAGTYQQLMQQFQTAQAQANADNNARYGQALGQYQGLYDRGMQYLNTLGQTQTTAINQAAAQQQAQAQQGLIDRGLGNTTVVDSVNRGIDSSRIQNLTNLNEQVAMAKLQTDQALTGNIANTIINKTTTAPGYDSIANLAGQYGQAQQNYSNNQLAAQLLIQGGLSSANQSLQAYLQQLQNQALLSGQQGVAVGGQRLT